MLCGVNFSVMPTVPCLSSCFNNLLTVTSKSLTKPPEKGVSIYFSWNPQNGKMSLVLEQILEVTRGELNVLI